MFSNKTPLRVVLVGGGYGVLHAYRSLAKRLGRRIARGHVKLIVVSPVASHQFHGWSAEVLQGIVSHENQLTSLREVMPLATHLRGALVRVDLVAQELFLHITGTDRIERVGYDHVLFGTGSLDVVGALPGLDEFALSIKRVDGIANFRQRLITSVDRAFSLTDEAARRRLLTFVIAGAGLAGAELAAATAELLATWRKDHPALQSLPVRVVLLHAGSQILPEWRGAEAKLAQYGERELARLGVEVRTGVKLSKVGPRAIQLSDGTEIETETVIPCLGQQRPVVPGTEALARADDGRYLTDSRLRVAGKSNVWVAGDCAWVRQPKRETACPSNALWAIKQGAHAGRNIAASISGDPVRPFAYRGLGQAASFGVGHGATELYGMLFVGWFAWILRLAFFLRFMPSRVAMLRTILDWLLFATWGRLQSSLEVTTALSTLAGGARHVPEASTSEGVKLRIRRTNATHPSHAT